MSLQLRRRFWNGRTYWYTVTAWYVVRIDGDGDTWYATIRHRDNDKLAQYIDRTLDHQVLTSRDQAAAMAEIWIHDHNGIAP